jgi:hypothetical protein
MAFVKERQYVFCEIETEFLNIISINLMFQRIDVVRMLCVHDNPELHATLLARIDSTYFQLPFLYSSSFFVIF